MARTYIPLVVIDADGTLVESAAVTIKDRTDDSTANVYDTETGGTPESQPLSTDTQGRVDAWVDRGVYKIEVTPPGQGAPTIIEYWDSTSSRDGAIETEQLEDSAVTTVKLGPDAVTNAKIADLAVDTEHLAASAVEEAKINANAVTNAKINNLAVSTGKIQDDAVTNAKIGTGAVDTTELADEAVTSAKLDPNVEAPTVADDAISTAKIQNLAVATGKIADDAVDDTKLKDDAVTDGNRAVTTNHIRDDAITTDKINAGAVTNTEVGASANIAYSKLSLTGNIVNNDIKSNAAIAYSKLAALTTGQILVGSGTSQPTAVTLSGDATVDGTGVLTVGADKIDATKLKDDPSVDGNRSVTTDHIRDDAITTAKIGTGEIVGANPTPANSHILGESIDTEDIADFAITSNKLAPDVEIPPGAIAEDQITDYELSDSATIDNDRAVTTDHIRNVSVTTAKLADLNVTTGKIANDAVDATKLKDDPSVDGNRAVTTDHIRDSAVTSAKIADLTIATGDIANDAVDATKLKDDPSVDGNRSVTTDHVRDSAITTAKINDLAVTSGKIGASQVIQGKLGTDAVQTANIEDDAVTTAKIDTDAVTSNELQSDAAVDLNRAVTTNHIRDLQVTNAKIANGTIVGSDKIQSGSIANAQISTTADIAFSKLATLTSGNIIVGNVSNDAASVAMSGDATIDNTGALSLSTGAVDTAELADGAVTTIKIGADQVTKDKILDNDLDASTLADDAVTDAILKDHATDNLQRAVTTNHIRNDAVTADKIADGIITGGTAGAGVKIAATTITNANISNSAAIALSKLATDPLARANHTGTQAHTTISDFDTGVRTNRLDQMAAPTATVDMNGQRLTSLNESPIASDEAVTKSYVDAYVQGVDVKSSVRLATTANITLSGTQTIDGVSAAEGDRVLVKDQSTGSQNGIYEVATGAWSRASDMDENAEVSSGLFTFVESGTANGDSGWVLTTDGTITLGTTALVFEQFTPGGAYYPNTTPLNSITAPTAAVDMNGKQLSNVLSLSWSGTTRQYNIDTPTGTPRSLAKADATLNLVYDLVARLILDLEEKGIIDEV